MQTNFSDTLALIDKTDAPDIYFKAAIEIANTFKSNLHVIYHTGTDNAEGNIKQTGCKTINVQHLLHSYRPILNSQLLLDIHPTQSSVRSAALKFAAKDKIGLILQWKKDDSVISFLVSMVRANMLSSRIRCPVLTLQRRITIHDIRNIILPVHKFLPANKLIIGIRLAKFLEAKIHLVSVVNSNKTASQDGLFLKACQLLQNHGNIDVECKMLKGISFYKSVMQYVIKVNVDIVVVCAGCKSMFQECYGLLITTDPLHGLRRAVMTVPNEQMNIE
jgi:hypothetical protein